MNEMERKETHTHFSFRGLQASLLCSGQDPTPDLWGPEQKEMGSLFCSNILKNFKMVIAEF